MSQVNEQGDDVKLLNTNRPILKESDIVAYLQTKKSEKENKAQEKEVYIIQLNAMLDEKRIQKELEIQKLNEVHDSSNIGSIQVKSKVVTRPASVKNPSYHTNSRNTSTGLDQSSAYQSKVRRIRELEREIFSQKFPESNFRTSERLKTLPEEKKVHVTRVSNCQIANTEKDIKNKLKTLETSNKALISQISEKMERDRANQEMRRKNEESFQNQKFGGSVRTQIACKIGQKPF